MFLLRELRGPVWDLLLTTKITKDACDLLTDFREGEAPAEPTEAAKRMISQCGKTERCERRPNSSQR
jgi:hypothetical protein